MRSIELLAPARNADIGIAAIDCGADAVYIAGPAFGARKDAPNPISEIRRLCDYASRFGVRVYVTFNILIRDEELEEVHSQMRLCEQAGASAFIIRDPRLCLFSDIHVPLHASTQCAIRDLERARLLQTAGCSRVVLERELAPAQIRSICAGLDCEVEAFVHGALCVCYSGQCLLSERLTTRSADRGECVQACRNLYDLVDDKGKVWLKDKALLSLRDLNLSEDLETLLDCGVTSLKIEGRLKNASYVKNVVRYYSQRLDELIARRPEDYRRASFGSIEGGFEASLDKTFNRSYTRLLFSDEKSWANLRAPKSMGEALGKVSQVRLLNSQTMEVSLERKDLDLHNGDGFAFVCGSKIVGFRADIAKSNTLRAKAVQGIGRGTLLYRNYNTVFEKQLEEKSCTRVLKVELAYKEKRSGEGLNLLFLAKSEDGRVAELALSDRPVAQNRERSRALYLSQLGKHSSSYSFQAPSLQDEQELAYFSAAELNAIRRELAEKLDAQPCGREPLLNNSQRSDIKLDTGRREGELMRSKYCIRRELACCLKDRDSEKGEFFLLNNGRKFPLRFDCKNCEMAVLEELR
ncbi:MAG: DUF3656 domain-containing protein [Candidatus Cryptobacteroides sp.]